MIETGKTADQLKRKIEMEDIEHLKKQIQSYENQVKHYEYNVSYYYRLKENLNNRIDEIKSAGFFKRLVFLFTKKI